MQPNSIGTLPVRVIGDSLPRHIFGKFSIVCAIFRQLTLALWLLQYHRNTYDALFIDQLSACIPLLKWFSSARILFYCHFPDKLLATRDSKLKEIYRSVFDKLEELSTGKTNTNDHSLKLTLHQTFLPFFFYFHRFI